MIQDNYPYHKAVEDIEDYNRLTYVSKQMLVNWFLFTAEVINTLRCEDGVEDTETIKLLRKVITQKRLKELTAV